MSLEPEQSATRRPTRIPWPPLLLAGALAGGYLMQEVLPVRWPGVDDTAAQAVGVGLGLAGVALLAWAALTLRHHKTTVLPNAPASALVTTGPYRFRRNPIYVADVLILLGLAELTKNIWLVAMAAAFAVLVTQLAIIPEERHLEAKFGEAWREYASKTRRWI